MGDSFKNQHLEQLLNIRTSMWWIISAHAVSLPHIEGFHFKKLPRKPWLVYPFLSKKLVTFMQQYHFWCLGFCLENRYLTLRKQASSSVKESGVSNYDYHVFQLISYYHREGLSNFIVVLWFWCFLC